MFKRIDILDCRKKKLYRVKTISRYIDFLILICKIYIRAFI